MHARQRGATSAQRLIDLAHLGDRLGSQLSRRLSLRPLRGTVALLSLIVVLQINKTYTLPGGRRASPSHTTSDLSSAQRGPRLRRGLSDLPVTFFGIDEMCAVLGVPNIAPAAALAQPDSASLATALLENAWGMAIARITLVYFAI